MSLLGEGQALFGANTGETVKWDRLSGGAVWTGRKHRPEHANLINDMVPSAGGVELFGQQSIKLFPHVDDTTGHGLDIEFPLLEELGVVQDQSDQSRAMSGGVTDLASAEDGELTADLVRGFRRGREDVKGTDTFTVQTCVLGETLADQQRDTASGEFPDRPRVLV